MRLYTMHCPQYYVCYPPHPGREEAGAGRTAGSGRGGGAGVGPASDEVEGPALQYSPIPATVEPMSLIAEQ